MGVSKAELNQEAHNYIEEVFEKRLREEGFACANDKLLCWYRLRDKQVIHSIIFHAPRGMLPVFLLIGYGIHPLFVKPVYTPSVRFSLSTSMEDETFCQVTLQEEGPISMAPYSSNAWVMAPRYGGRGIYTFDSMILPKMDSAGTIEDTYLLYKRKLVGASQSCGKENLHKKVTPLFADMALYVDDYEMYPLCQKRILAGLEWCNTALQKDPEDKSAIAYFRRLESLRKALFEDGRKAYLEVLDGRIECNLRYVQKKFRIGVD